MKFARIVFALAGIYGLVVLLPMYFERARYEHMAPPAVAHLELYYGFIGVGVAWQLAFLVISVNPGRYRLMMLPAIIEKSSYGVAVLVLGFRNLVTPATMAFGTVDLLLGVLFAVAYLRLGAQLPPGGV